MNFPPSIFCGSSTCESGCKLPRKNVTNNNSNVMVDPIILPCSHKFCLSCLQKMNKQCSLCSSPSLSSLPSVDPVLQEMCTWFRTNESMLTHASEGMIERKRREKERERDECALHKTNESEGIYR